MKKNFDDYIDKFFDEKDEGNEDVVLEKLASDGSQSLALAASVIISYVGRVTEENVDKAKDELTNLITGLIQASTTYGVIRFLEDLTNEGGVKVDE